VARQIGPFGSGNLKANQRTATPHESDRTGEVSLMGQGQVLRLALERARRLHRRPECMQPEKCPDAGERTVLRGTGISGGRPSGLTAGAGTGRRPAENAT